MQQLKDFTDNRLIDGCIYCSGKASTREHIPSRILLEKPFPENLPVMPACLECNNSFSMDEEYVACVLGCILSQTSDPNLINNPRISKTLIRKPALRAHIEESKFQNKDGLSFKIDIERFSRIIKKLAVGHAAYDLGLSLKSAPTILNWELLSLMNTETLEEFDAPEITEQIGEVGSRNIQRMYILDTVLCSPTGELVNTSLVVNDWVEVQEGIYRYHAIHSHEGVTIKIVLYEYIACELFWKL